MTVNQGTTSTATSSVYGRPAGMATQQVYAYALGNSDINSHFLFRPSFGQYGQDSANGEQYGFPSHRSCCASFSVLDNGNLQQNGNSTVILYQNAGDPRIRENSTGNNTQGEVRTLIIRTQMILLLLVKKAEQVEFGTWWPRYIGLWDRRDQKRDATQHGKSEHSFNKTSR